MKMWAVFDKDGKQVSDACDNVKRSWFYLFSKDQKRFLTLYAFVDFMSAEGFTCQPVVVMREEVYNDTKKLCQWIGMTKEGKDIYNEFLKAGE
jgi:hypothetical protein